ncbi:MAG: dihydrolipoyl dehydrogenase [Bacteroidales bacterium]|nr:dihydrolipoyl dehydrogenase [Bacteroidales bacterium]
MSNIHDLAIIGGGPAGYVAAERAGSAGTSVILFEKNELGGVCLNEGCIPTKALLCCAKTYDHARHGKAFGVSAENVSFDFAKMMERKTRVVRRLVGGVKAKMKAAGVEVIKDNATIVGKTGDGFEIKCGEETFIARNLLLCTGSSAFIPPIPGLAESEAAVTNREILSLEDRPESLVIIGGGVIGMEFASFFNSIGTKVTVIEMLPEILGGLDEEISSTLRGIYAKRGVEFHLNCKVTGVNGHSVIFETPEGTTEQVNGDRILVSVGRRANVKGLGLENIGVEFDRGVKVDDHMRTNVSGVYAAGDITGFSLLAHTASREGEVAVANILGGNERMSYSAIPGVVYTNPEVAGVGLTEEKAEGAGILKLPMAYAGRYVAENEDITGLCKIIYDKSSGRVLGMHMLGTPCSEIIQSGCIAIETGMTVDQLRKIVFPHPSVSEIIKETCWTENA